jgi:hypothetical protein
MWDTRNERNDGAEAAIAGRHHRVLCCAEPGTPSDDRLRGQHLAWDGGSLRRRMRRGGEESSQRLLRPGGMPPGGGLIRQRLIQRHRRERWRGLRCRMRRSRLGHNGGEYPTWAEEDGQPHQQRDQPATHPLRPARGRASSVTRQQGDKKRRGTRGDGAAITHLRAGARTGPYKPTRRRRGSTRIARGKEGAGESAFSGEEAPPPCARQDSLLLKRERMERDDPLTPHRHKYI